MPSSFYINISDLSHNSPFLFSLFSLFYPIFATLMHLLKQQISDKYLHTIMLKKDYTRPHRLHAHGPACEIHSRPKPAGGCLGITTLEQLRADIKEKPSAAVKNSHYTIVLLTAGTAEETIGHRRYIFQPNTLFFIPENQLHTIHRRSADIKGVACAFDAEYFLLCLRNQVKLQQYPFFQPEQPPVLNLTVTEAAQIAALFTKIKEEYDRRKTLNDDLLARLYLNVLLIEIERIYHHKRENMQAEQPRRQQLVARFRQLTEKNFLVKRKVTDYARLLYVTPHYLNDTVKALTGQPASYYIQQQCLLEAKARLVQTDMQIAAIAAELNFSDVSYFCRFFRKHTGQSPAKYRMESVAIT